MLKVTVCIGSACHIKGSRRVVEQLQFLIADKKLENKISLDGAFCMGMCQNGVCVEMDNSLYSVSPDNVSEFFEKEILSRI